MNRKVSLFTTCLVDQFYPDVGKSTVRVLQQLGIEVDFPKDQICCGQVAFNSGYWSDAKPTARRLIAALEGSNDIVAPSGSCVSMVRNFYRELFEDEPETLNNLKEIIPRIYEFSEYLVDILSLDKWVETLEARSIVVTYHEACHLKRELGAITQARRIITSLPGVKLVEMKHSDVCCGFGGSFSIKYPEISSAILRDKLDNIRNTEAQAVISCDSSCLMQIKGGLDKEDTEIQTLHLSELLYQVIFQL